MSEQEEKLSYNVEGDTSIVSAQQYAGSLKAQESMMFPVLDGQEGYISLNNPSNQYKVFYHIYNQTTNTLFKKGSIAPGKSLSLEIKKSKGFNTFRIQNTSKIIPNTGGQPFLGYLVIVD